MKRTVNVKKCLNKFSLIADEVEAIITNLPPIAKVSVKDLARTITNKYKSDYTTTVGLVTTYCRLRAIDGQMVLSRGMISNRALLIPAKAK